MGLRGFDPRSDDVFFLRRAVARQTPRCTPVIVTVWLPRLISLLSCFLIRPRPQIRADQSVQFS